MTVQAKGHLPKLAAGIGLVVLAAVGWRLWPEAAPERQAPLVPVSVAQVSRADVPLFLTGLGTVVSPHEVVVRPQIDGQLVSLHFREGETVRRGALLAQIDDRAIRARLAQAKAARAQAAAQLQQAEQDLARYRTLQATSTIAEQAVAQQATRVAELKAALEAAAASVAAADTDLSHTRITAPLTGRAGLRRVDAGNQVRASDAGGIVTLTQVDPLAVVFSLPQDVLPRLHPLKTGKRPATVDVFAREGGEALASGRLETFDNSVDAASGTIRLKALFPGSTTLWPGQFVSARLHAGVLEQALVVPASALQRSREGVFVWKVADGKADPAPVSVAHEGGGVAAIREGLAAGDIVVTDGQLRLKPGARVKTGEEQPDAAR